MTLPFVSAILTGVAAHMCISTHSVAHAAGNTRYVTPYPVNDHNSQVYLDVA